MSQSFRPTEDLALNRVVAEPLVRRLARRGKSKEMVVVRILRKWYRSSPRYM